jgi:very-short-patch-repair endonuclease
VPKPALELEPALFVGYSGSKDAAANTVACRSRPSAKSGVRTPSTPPLRLSRRRNKPRSISANPGPSAPAPGVAARHDRSGRGRSHVTSRIEQYARQHRTALNSSEQALWSEIRGGRLGVWFRRQVVMGHFIVDFLAPAARVIVEVDGGYHVTRVGAAARRDRKLTRMGDYRVLRLDAELVRRDVHAAVEQIRAALG